MLRFIRLANTAGKKATLSSYTLLTGDMRAALRLLPESRLSALTPNDELMSKYRGAK